MSGAESRWQGWGRPGGGGRTRDDTWKPPVPELRVSLLPALHPAPTSHFPLEQVDSLTAPCTLGGSFLKKLVNHEKLSSVPPPDNVELYCRISSLSYSGPSMEETVMPRISYQPGL